MFALWLTRRHPYVAEFPQLDPQRRSLGLVGLGIFLVTFTPEPFHTGSLLELIKELARMVLDRL